MLKFGDDRHLGQIVAPEVGEATDKGELGPGLGGTTELK